MMNITVSHYFFILFIYYFLKFLTHAKITITEIKKCDFQQLSKTLCDILYC